MSEQLPEAVAHLRTLSTQLNDVTDQATAAVRRVEVFLNQECRLGLAVYVPVTVAGPGLPTLQLGYARCGNRYRIVVRSLSYLTRDGRIVRDEDGNAPVIEQEEQVAWSECARAVKFEAFPYLPALLGALQEHVSQVIARADTAMAAARQITDVLGDAPEPAEGDDDACDERRGCRDKEGRHGHHGHRDHDHHGHGHRDERGPVEERGRRDQGWPKPRGDAAEGRRGKDRS